MEREKKRDCPRGAKNEAERWRRARELTLINVVFQSRPNQHRHHRRLSCHFACFLKS